ncbi:outer membrane biogenesis protein BamB [Posidoniimonas polymericola]|uniref:Outer membrane biogenesis protein BamB n=1 Tax=Posidoniimonas polymericola TaxID=2528002 RepID=A0A5C5YRP1_9BACT|nr:PQQ-binding-like beta-propeller repeat protein [Posidoniimonas polymericola]TWT77493.1 outer membrane biogenesis protein BamB [Posidoniimonas polymericola]
MKQLFGMMIVTLVSISVTCGDDASAGDWDRFRGPNGAGVIEGPPVPTTWSADQNLKWRTPLPGKGTSSPVVSEGRVYLTAYTGYGLDEENPGDPTELTRHLLALDRATGEELWRKSVASGGDEDPYKGFITQHGYASSTPASDGEHVFAVLGKSGLFAFDRDGNQLWQVDLGTKSDPAKWGDGSSPILVGDIVVVNAGILGNKLLGLNKETGEELWSVEDEAFTNSWSTPTTVEVGGRTLVLFNVPKKIIAVDPRDGSTVWTAASPLDSPSGSIVVQDGKAYLMGGRGGDAMAVAVDGQGDVSATHTLWREKLRSGIDTPVAVGGNLHWTSGGVFYAASMEDGDYVYKERLPRLGGPTGGFPNSDYASPIAVGDQIVQFTRSGESYVIQAGDEFQVTAHNPAFADDDSDFSATPAASDGELFVRSDKYLYCLSAE